MTRSEKTAVALTQNAFATAGNPMLNPPVCVKRHKLTQENQILTLMLLPDDVILSLQYPLYHRGYCYDDIYHNRVIRTDFL